MNRKEALKRAKEENAMKSQLRKDIAEFMVQYTEVTTHDIMSAYKVMVREGSRGYHKMRDKDLIRDFQEAVSDLNNEHKAINFYESKYYNSLDRQLSHRQREFRLTYTQEAEDLMNRLVEEMLQLGQ